MGLYDWISESVIEDVGRRDPVRIGWLLTDNKSGVLFEDPERIRSVEMNRDHAKSASRCPAVLNMEARYFAVKCPMDFHIRFERDKDGKPLLRNVLGDKSALRGNKMAKLVNLVSEPEWRYKDRPTVQIITPYLFLADEPVFLSQVPPFFHYLRTPWPGTLFGGRFPLHVWPRQLMWAFEWHDTSKDLVLKRGDPWFYVTFETMPQDRAVTVVEAQMTDDVKAYTEQISGAVNYVNQTFSLFKTAEKRRPKTLITPVERN